MYCSRNQLTSVKKVSSSKRIKVQCWYDSFVWKAISNKFPSRSFTNTKQNSHHWNVVNITTADERLLYKQRRDIAHPQTNPSRDSLFPTLSNPRIHFYFLKYKLTTRWPTKENVNYFSKFVILNVISYLEKVINFLFLKYTIAV